jgi:hypothetical protein
MTRQEADDCKVPRSNTGLGQDAAQAAGSDDPKKGDPPTDRLHKDPDEDPEDEDLDLSNFIQGQALDHVSFYAYRFYAYRFCMMYPVIHYYRLINRTSVLLAL